MSTQMPTLGRIVHYHDESADYPALVTNVRHNGNGRVDLAVFFTTHMEFKLNVSPGQLVGNWSWPVIR